MKDETGTCCHRCRNESGCDVQTALQFIGDEAGGMIIYGNDGDDTETRQAGNGNLIEQLTHYGYFDVTTTPKRQPVGRYRDLDEYFSEPRTYEEYQKDIVYCAHKVAPPFEVIGEQAKAILVSKVDMNERHLQFGALIVKDVRQRAQLARVNGHAVILHAEGARSFPEMIEVLKGGTDFSRFMKRYGIVEPKWVDAAGQHLGMEAELEQAVHELAVYEKDSHRLFLNNFNGGVLQITTETTVLRQNGSAEVPWMRQYSHGWSTGDSTPAIGWYDTKVQAKLDSRPTGKHGMRHRPDSLLEELILSKINYASSPDIYKQLLKSWIISLFFQSEQKSRPAVMFEGVGGGGKSTFGSLVGCWLLGKNFRVENAPESASALSEKMSSSPLVVFDEFQDIDPAVEARFRVLLTGGTDKRRELYTTANQVELPCKAAVILTSNSSPIRQAATTRRFITVPVASRQANIGDRVFQSLGASLLPKFLEQRGALWVELVRDLQAVLVSLQHTCPDTKTSYSMSDFGVLVQRCADHERWRHEAQEMFRKLEQSQEDQAIEHSFFLPLLRDYLDSHPEDRDKPLTAQEWCDRLVCMVPDHDRAGLQRLQKQAFGAAMTNQAQVYERRLGMKKIEERHIHRRRYSFHGTILTYEPTAELLSMPLDTIADLMSIN